VSVSPDLLRPHLAGWDGRRKAALEEVHARFSQDEGYQDALVALVDEAACADAATWLLKHAGAAHHAASLVAPAVTAPGWAAKLHVLQMLAHADVPPPAEALSALIAQATNSDRPMLRAWGYTAADLMAGWYPAEVEAMTALLAQARVAETAGSVLARLKRCKH